MAGGRARAQLSVQSLHRDYFPFIWRSLRGLGVAPAALDDAAQEVLLVVHRRLEEFEGRSTPRTWLFSIAYHVAQNFKRSARRRAVEELDEGLPSLAPGPDVSAEGREAAAFVERFLETLDEGRRAVFVLALLEELPAPEVAAALGVPVNTVYSRIRLVREDFRRALALEHAEVTP